MALPDPTYHTLDWRPPGMGYFSARRRIGHYLNHRNPVGAWVTPAFDGNGVPIISPPAIARGAGPPQGWQGKSTYLDSVVNAPMRFCCRSTADADNPHVWSVSVDATPDIWLEWTPLGTTPGATVSTSDGGRTAVSVDAWTDTDIELHHNGASVKEDIVVKSSSAPAYYEWRVEISSGATYEVTDDTLIVRDALGDIRLQTRPPSGYDASGGNPEMTGKGIGCTLTQVGTWGPGGRWPIVRLTYSAADMIGATYPVRLDPTTTISGTTDLEDTWIYSGSPDTRNWGSSPNAGCGGGDRSTLSTYGDFKLLWRVADTTKLPAGSYSQVTHNHTRFGHVWSVNANTFLVNPFAHTTNWVEGTKNGVAETGSTCWNRLITGGTLWNTTGCEDATNDFDSSTLLGSLAYSAKTGGADVAGSFTLTPSFYEAARDAGYDAGVVHRVQTPGTNLSSYLFYSTEGGTPWSLDVDYSLGGWWLTSRHRIA